MKKFVKLPLVFLVFMICLIMLTGCSGSDGEVDKLGRLEGIWVNRETGEAYRLTKEGLFQSGKLDDANDIFTVTTEYIYLVENKQVVIYQVDCTDKSYDDWLKIGGYFDVDGTKVTPKEGYIEHKNPYETALDIQNIRPDLDQVKKHLRGEKTYRLCGPMATQSESNSPATGEPLQSTTEPMDLPTATRENLPTATTEPTKAQVYTINGICTELGGGSTSGMLYTPPMVMVFQDGLMYAGQEGMSVEDIIEMAEYNSVWGGGAPFTVTADKIIMAMPDGSSIEMQRDGSHFWFNNAEYECPAGSITVQ